MFTYKGKTALITGASSGIGEAFAHALAQRGMSVILVARSEERLRTLAQDIIQKHSVRAEVLAADLGRADAAKFLQETIHQRGLTVDLLVNNAGFGTRGYFESLDPLREHQEILLNVAAVVSLTHAFLPDILARGGGGLINVASTAAFQPVPFMAVYGASKAFVLSFSEALTEEYRGRDLRVVALCPGNTETPFHSTVGEENTFGKSRTAEQVVSTGLRALDGKGGVIVDGAANGLTAFLPNLLPRAVIARLAGNAFRPRRSSQEASLAPRS